MMTYVTAFIFYTLAMIGILLIGFVVYKKTFQPNAGQTKGLIKVLDSLPIGNKKHLLVVKIKNEKFLIASGLEHTTFLSKLEDNVSIKQIKEEIITPEVVDEEIIDEIYDENFAPKRTVRFDDYINSKAQKSDEIQRKFKELYEKEEAPQPKINKEAQTRKEILKQLLKDVNSNTKGGRF